MRTRIMAIAATASLGLALAVWVAPKALALEYDVVHVKLPYAVTVGAKILAPGDYTIRQLRIPDSTDLLFYSADGTKFVTSALTNSTLFGNTDDPAPTTSSVILQHVGDDYYFNKLFVSGKDYGYELPLPASVKSAEANSKAELITLPATLGAN